MKKIQVFSFLLILLILTVCTNQAAASKRFPLTVKLLWTSSYDDNILKYSPRDLDRFETNSEIHPSEITTADDWINTFGLRVYKDFKLSKKIRFRPYYSVRFSLYSVNQLKNVQSHYLLARFTYRYRVYLYLQYTYMPGYYLRAYKDRDLNEYHNCEFDLYKPAARLKFRFKPFEFEGQFGREWTYYNSYFTEYDSEALFSGISASYQAPFGLDVSAGYLLKISDNVGFSQAGLAIPGTSEEDTEYGDASYEEDRFNLGVGYELPVKSNWDWKIWIDFERRLRYYQSDLSSIEDPFHAGRKDRRDFIKPKITFSPSPTIDIEFRFIYDWRRTDSPEPIVSSIKNFIHRTIELTMIYQVF